MIHPVEVRKAADGQGDVITGYGAVFFNAADPGTEYALWSDIIERILPGAFDRALREDDVRCFFNHDPNLILGRRNPAAAAAEQTLSLSIDSVGLRYSVRPSDSAIAQHPLSAVGRGDVSGSSFMFEVGKSTWVEEKTAGGDTRWIREITEIAPLYELGPVCFPAYEATTAAVEGRGTDCQSVLLPASAEFRAWQQRHIDRAKESLAAHRTGLTLERLGRHKRHERRLRVRV